MRAYDCVKEFEALAYKLEKENIALQKEIKSVLDALNTAANEGGFDGYDEDTPLLVNLKSHWDRLYMTYDKELQRLKRINADLFSWKEGKKGIEEYYSMVSQRNAACAENAALRHDKERLDFLESLIGRHVMTPCHKNKHQPTGMRKDYCGADLHVIHDNAALYIRDDLSHATVSAHGATFREVIDAARAALERKEAQP